jgi:hypothetical protein
MLGGAELLTGPHAEKVLYVASVDLVDESHVDGQDRCV